MEELQGRIAAFEFARAFQEVLGWSRFRHASSLSLPDIGALPRGWKTRSTRQQMAAATKVQFYLEGVATLHPQVVLHCRKVGGGYITGLQRHRLTREISKLFYQPIIIFTSEEYRSQDWCFPLRIGNFLDVVSFACDGPKTIGRLCHELSALVLGADQLHLLNDHLAVHHLVGQVRDELSLEVELNPALKFAQKFAKYGQHAYELALRAHAMRVWEVPIQISIGQSAKNGDPQAIERFYDMHLYLAMERAREYLKPRSPFISDFEDYVAVACNGIGRGLANYDPMKGFAPSTLVFYHIDKQIQREFSRLELPMWIPVHVQQELLKACWIENAVFDDLVRANDKVPSDREVLSYLGLDDDDIAVYGRFKTSRLWQSRVNWDELEIAEVEPELRYEEDVDSTEDELIAISLVQNLPDRLRDVISLRFGLHPSCEGDELTLDEVGQIMGITRERARQLILRAMKRLTTAADPALLQETKAVSIGMVPLPTKAAVLPKPAKTANQFLDSLLDYLGRTADPTKVFNMVKERFPESLIRLDKVYTKMASRGWYSSLTMANDRPAPICPPITQLEAKPVIPIVSQMNLVLMQPLPLASEVPIVTRGEAARDQLVVPEVPTHIQKANAYVEYILDTYGNLYSPESLYEARERHFPHSIITLAMIRDKYRRRGYKNHIGTER